MFPLTRREALAGLAATGALPLLSTTALAAPANEAQAKALFDSFADHLLQLKPEKATSQGVDTGVRAPLRHRLEDRSAAGQHRKHSELKRERKAEDQAQDACRNSRSANEDQREARSDDLGNQQHDAADEP